MATSAGISLVVLVQIFSSFMLTDGLVDDLGVLTGVAGFINDNLARHLETVSGRDMLEKKYKNESADMNFKLVDGDELAANMAAQLEALLDKKMSALRRSVEWAEEIAANYQWIDDLLLGDVPYVDTKNINQSDPSFQYGDQFKQVVSFENSSVHIPVEIYEGGLDILNGLAWTNGLDEIWQKNKAEDDNLLWQYFGSQTGIMRNFPASEWQGSEPDLYDVRRRPWYTQGASSPKDMLILVDTSGSTQGQALSLMRQSIDSMLDTLGENDFINIAHFSEKAKFVVPCFNTFVQANYWNKQVLRQSINEQKADGMGNYNNAFKFAFEQFEAFSSSENRTEGEGADCNRIIMFLTDGGTEMPDEVFEKYNWPEKKVRIFSYAVGPTANPIAAVQMIACSNRGYFYKIPAMGAIRSVVQEHVAIVARPLQLAKATYIMWSNIYRDALSVRKKTPKKTWPPAVYVSVRTYYL